MFRALVVLSAVVLGAIASPTALPRDTCTPNFQGQAQRISVPGGALAWTAQTTNYGSEFTLQPGTSALGEFYVQFTGQPDNSYNIRLQAETDGTLTAGPAHGELTLNPLDLSTSQPPQRFTISCSTCPSTSGGATLAQGCVIENPGTGLCVGTYVDDQLLSLGDCASAGVYDFTGSV